MIRLNESDWAILQATKRVVQRNGKFNGRNESNLMKKDGGEGEGERGNNGGKQQLGWCKSKVNTAPLFPLDGK